MAENNKLDIFPGGAKRDAKPPYYREIPKVFLEKLGRTLQHGAEKYNESPLDSNWKKGDLTFAIGCFDHLIEHLYAWREGKTNEDHLGHAAANLAFLTWFQEHGVWDPATNNEADKELVGSIDRLTAIQEMDEALREAENVPAPPSAPSKLWDIIRRKGAGA